MPFRDVMTAELRGTHTLADGPDEEPQEIFVPRVGVWLAVFLAPIEIDLGKGIDRGQLVLDSIAVGHQLMKLVEGRLLVFAE